MFLKILVTVMYWVSCARDVLGMRKIGIKTIVVIELNL